jgi:metal-sulfur cluster biosynthetic enzyme
MNPSTPKPVVPGPSPLLSSPSSVHEAAVWEALRLVVDPEIGVNLVDLGLIYSVDLEGTVVRILMTVTTPGCPMEQSLTFGVETAVLSVEGVSAVEVQVVHEPPWNPSMMTPEGREAADIR